MRTCAPKRPILACIVLALALAACGEKANPTISIQDAAGNGDLLQLKRYIYHHRDLNFADRAGLTALHCAAIGNQPEAAQLLLSAGASTAPRDPDGNTPLDKAISNGNDKVAEIILNKVPDVKKASTQKGFPLHLACRMRSVRIAGLLLAKGADPNASTEDGVTPLMVAAAAGQLEIAKALVEKGANVNAQSLDGSTPLRMAQKGSKDLATFLKKHGAKD